MDKSLTIPPNYTTSIEVYFHQYLVKEPPDVVLLTLPIVHEMIDHNDNATVVLEELQTFIAYTEKVVPKNINVLWIPQTHTQKGNNTDIVRLNCAVYDQLRSRFLNVLDPWWGFYNEHSMTAAAEDLHADSVHMQKEYYEIIMELFLSLFCLNWE